MPTPQSDSQAPVTPTPPPPSGVGGGQLLDAIKAFVAAERMDMDRDTHSGQNAYDALRKAKARLYHLADTL